MDNISQELRADHHLLDNITEELRNDHNILDRLVQLAEQNLKGLNGLLSKEVVCNCNCGRAERGDAKTNDETPAKTLRQLLDIEDRGNVAIDYRTGEVELRREIEFIAKKEIEEPLA